MFQKLLDERKFPELIYIVRRLWDDFGWLYLKRNRNAVDRVKEEFVKLTGHQPYASTSSSDRWDQQIAKYVDRLGVKVLIDDMRLAVRRFNPNSIVYFLHSSGNMPCRWENLLLDDIETKSKRDKQKEKKFFENLARDLGLNKQTEPTWVKVARERLSFLQKEISHKHCTDERRSDAMREIAQITARLKKYSN